MFPLPCIEQSPRLQNYHSFMAVMSGLEKSHVSQVNSLGAATLSLPLLLRHFFPFLNLFSLFPVFSVQVRRLERTWASIRLAEPALLDRLDSMRQLMEPGSGIFPQLFERVQQAMPPCIP